MNIRYTRLFFLSLLVLMISNVAFAGKPAFKPGEIVIKGDSLDFSDYEVIKTLPYSGYTVIKVAPGKEMGQLRRFRDKGKKANLNFIVNQFVTPNDPGYGDQWHMSAVQAEQAWDVTTGVGVKVAVIDTGLVTGGSDGVNCVVAAKNTIDGSTNVLDGNGHGTHVTGTINQNTNNSTGVTGLAYNACVIPIKALGDNGSGTDADLAEAIAYAVDSGARVISMSLGYPAAYSLSDFAGSASYSMLNSLPDDVVVVAASGNEGASNVSYPASHPNTIAVGAVAQGNGIASYSNQGPSLDLVAPGSGIIQETRNGGSWGYYSYSGTSMATPSVSAAVALLVSANVSLTKADVLAKLKSSALDLGTVGEDSIYGAGLIQVSDSLVGIGEPVNQSPVASFTANCDDLFLCTFISESVDQDGYISSLSWNFGDGSPAVNTALSSVDYQFESSGDYAVTLTVTDDDSATSSTSNLITLVGAVPTEIPSGVTVWDNANGTASIDWDYSDQTATQFQIERRKQNRKGVWGGGSLIANVASTSLTYTDASGKGVFAYRVRATNENGGSEWSTWVDVTVTDISKSSGSKGGSGTKGKKK